MQSNDSAVFSMERSNFAQSAGSPISLSGHSDWKTNRSNKTGSNSDPSPSSTDAGSHQHDNRALDRLDDEHFVDDDEDIEDDDDYDEDDYVDDDGIVLDCDDDHDSLHDIELSLSFFKQREQNKRDFLMTTNNNPSERTSFGTSHVTSPFHMIGYGSAVNNCQFNLATKINPTQLSPGGGNRPYPTASDNYAVDGKANFLMRGNQNEKKRLCEILKRNGKLQANSLLCCGCGELIFDRCLLKVDDRPWHSSCLKCKICSIPLTSRCYLRNDQVYCRDDFMKEFPSKCAVCEVSIPSTESVRRANENVYHLDCFRCEVCKDKLGTGDQFYLVNGHKLMCKKDYEQQKAREVDLDNSSKRPRTSISAKQLETLKSAYSQSSKPARHVREQLSHDTGLDLRVVQVWFQNRRAKEKRLNKETEQGKYSHFRRSSSLTIGSLDQELNDTTLTKRSSRSGGHGGRKRVSESTGRTLHHPQLGTNHHPTVPQNGMLNPSYPLSSLSKFENENQSLGSRNDSCFAPSPLNASCSGPIPVSLHAIPGPSDVPTLYPPQVSDPLSSTNPLVPLSNSAQSSYTNSLSEQSLLPLMATPANFFRYNTPPLVPHLQNQNETAPIAPVITSSKPEPEFQPTMSDTDNELPPQSLPQSCVNVLNAIEIFGNRFATTFSQPKYGLNYLPDANGMTALSDISAPPGPWLHDRVSNV